MNIAKFAQRYNELHTLSEERNNKIEEKLEGFRAVYKPPVTREELERDILYIIELLLLQAEEKKKFKFGKTRIGREGLVFRGENGGLRYREYRHKTKTDLHYMDRHSGSQNIIHVDQIRSDFGVILPESFYNMLDEMNQHLGGLTQMNVSENILCEIPCNITSYIYQSYGTPKFLPIDFTILQVHMNSGHHSASFELRFKDSKSRSVNLNGPLAMTNELHRKVWRLLNIAQKKVNKHCRTIKKKNMKFSRLYEKYDYAKYLATRGI